MASIPKEDKIQLRKYMEGIYYNDSFVEGHQYNQIITFNDHEYLVSYIFVSKKKTVMVEIDIYNVEKFTFRFKKYGNCALC